MIFHPEEFRKKAMEATLRREAKQALSEEKKNRGIAEKNDQHKPVFLRPNDVAGEYDFKRMLKTTLGGVELRNITLADLEAFQRNIDTIGALYKGGITIPQIISLSRADDIDRANEQIHFSMPVYRRAGVVTFVTNASKDSDKGSHTVNVEFLAYDSVVLNPKREKISTIRNRLTKGKVKIECDCGRFTYWYRYIATLGSFVHGRKEASFPKERNPDLTGIACKHILRTLQVIQSPIGQSYLRQAIDKDRTKQHGRQYSTTAKDIAKILDFQTEKQDKKSNQIKTSLSVEVNKLTKRIENRNKVLEQNNAKIHEKKRRIERLKRNFNQGLIGKEDFEFYMKVENERKY